MKIDALIKRLQVRLNVHDENLTVHGMVDLKTRDAMERFDIEFELIKSPKLQIPTQRILGIDVSNWQKPIDWRDAKKQGIEFAFCKATESNHFKAHSFVGHFQGASNAGVLVGAYHFFRMDSSGIDQARFFWNTIKDVYLTNQRECLPPVLDFESHDGSPSENDLKSAMDFLRELEDLSGIIPIVYTGPAFFKSMGSKGIQGFEKYPLWIAHYTQAENPKVPAPWSKWTFWQFTDKFVLNGYKGGGVDANYFAGSLEDLRKLMV